MSDTAAVRFRDAALVDAVADALRGTDVELRGGNVAGLLPFDQLSHPEQHRWRSLACAAQDAIDHVAAMKRDDDARYVAQVVQRMVAEDPAEAPSA